jgi:hypothetical protein
LDKKIFSVTVYQTESEKLSGDHKNGYRLHLDEDKRHFDE